MFARIHRPCIIAARCIRGNITLVGSLSALGYGSAIGTLGGLVGLGGAEFRLPVLMGPFGLKARQAVPVNLLVSLVTIAASIAARSAVIRLEDVAPYAVETLSVLLGACAAAWFGAGLLGRMADRGLDRLVGLLLLAVALVLAAEAAFPLGSHQGLPADPLLRAVVGLCAGVAIGTVSSLLGVAGGELIIPTLVLAFGAPIKAAGTASLLISAPTVLIGVTRYGREGAYGDPMTGRRIAAPMALGSIGGAALGAALLGIVPDRLLKAVLGAILLVSAIKLLRRP